MVQRYGCFDFFSDLCQEGYIALIDAVERFDESKGFKFWSWAFLKVRGAMINGLKQWHWDAIYTYPSTKGDRVTFRLVSVDNYALIPLDKTFSGFRDIDLVPVLDIKAALDILEDRERHVIVRTFLAGYTLEEVGKELGLEECTVCNIRRVALKKMRTYMVRQGV